MNALLNAIGQNLLQHLTSIGVGSGVLFFAIVHNMPENPPTSMQEYWTWVRDALQTSIPVRQGRQPNPQQPVSPAQEQK